MTNNIQCQDCVHFDRQYKNLQKTDLVSRKRLLVKQSIKGHGFCAARSTYPCEEQEGQTFPPDVKRAGPKQLANMVPVVPDKIIVGCVDARLKD
jgi:hypothetical protein